MKSSSILLIVALTISINASQVFAQHGHGVGHAGMHGGAHGSQIKTAGHTPVNPATVPNQLTKNPALTARLRPLLLAGTNLETAAAGFKNLGQFVAAVHVSHNLQIPFDKLKADMTGLNHDSLGRAIQDLRPDLSHKTVKSEVKTAEREAKLDLETHESPEKDQTATIAQKH